MNGEGCILNKKTGANPPVSCYVSGALSVVVPPAVRGGKFRTVETLQVQGLEFEEQARVIEQFHAQIQRPAHWYRRDRR